MSSDTTTPIRSFMEERWRQYGPYLSQPLAAAGAIVPVEYGLRVKSAQQVGEPLPRFDRSVIRRGFSAAPIAGAAVGLQMIAQRTLEEGIKRANIGEDSYLSKVASSAVVGGLSAPGYIALNGHFLNMTPRESFAQSSWRQAAAISGRETSFVLSLSLSEPFAEKMKGYFGDSCSVEVGSAFVSGAAGSLAGHAFDTWLTCDQRGVAIRSAACLARGAAVKSVSTGAFAAIYYSLKKTIEPKKID